MKSKLTIHQQIAKRDAEENPQPKKRGFGRRPEHFYVNGVEVTKEVWMNRLSTFGTPNYHGPVIDENGKTKIV